MTNHQILQQIVNV